jgi:hypothetical protein
MRHILFAMSTLAACTGPAPDAVNAPPPCVFPEPEEICPWCDLDTDVDLDGLVDGVIARGESGDILYRWRYDPDGNVLTYEYAMREMYGCWPDGGVAWRTVFEGRNRTDQCWTEEGAEFPCTTTPEAWAVAMREARSGFRR